MTTQVILTFECEPDGEMWCAHRDGSFETGPHGFGDTEEEAKRNLLEKERTKAPSLFARYKALTTRFKP